MYTYYHEVSTLKLIQSIYEITFATYTAKGCLISEKKIFDSSVKKRSQTTPLTTRFEKYSINTQANSAHHLQGV